MKTNFKYGKKKKRNASWAKDIIQRELPKEFSLSSLVRLDRNSY